MSTLYLGNKRITPIIRQGTSGEVSWGSIRGNIHNQTDLMNALNGKVDQYTSLPTPTSSNLGKIVQYVGETTSDYTKGYFYICESIIVEETTVYIWNQINVQPTTSSSFIFEQGIPSASWVINHNLNKYPSVSVVDSGGNEIICDVTYNSMNQVTLTMSAAFAGKAYLN